MRNILSAFPLLVAILFLSEESEAQTIHNKPNKLHLAPNMHFSELVSDQWFAYLLKLRVVCLGLVLNHPSYSPPPPHSSP